MKWIEMIMVRTRGNGEEILDATLRGAMNRLVNEAEVEGIRVFGREKLTSDFCLVIFHSRKKLREGGSTLGLHLAAAFKEFGFVNHTIWSEIDRLE